MGLQPQDQADPADPAATGLVPAAFRASDSGIPGADSPGRHSRGMTPTYPQILMADAPAGADDRSDDALLRRYASSGEQLAIAEFAHRHAELAWRIAVRMLGNASDADDAVQSAFLQILRHAKSYRPRGDARGWLATIVLNEARQLVRRSARIRRREVVPPAQPPAPPDPELLERLRAALNRLPDRFRLPLELHVVEGLAHAEIARALDIAEGTARSRTSRAITRLRQLLGRDEAGAMAVLPLWRLHLAPPPAGLAERLVQRLPAGSGHASAWGLGKLMVAGVAALLVLCAGWFVVGHEPGQAVAALSVKRTSAGPQLSTDLPPADPFAITMEVRLWHDDLPGSLQRIGRALPSASPVRFATGPGLQFENGLKLLPWEGVTYQAVPARPLRQALDALAQQLGLRWRAVGAVAALSKPASAGTLAAALPLLRRSDAPGLRSLPGVDGLVDDLDALPVLLRVAFQDPAPSTDALLVIFAGMEIGDPAAFEGDEPPARSAGTFCVLADDADVEAMARRVVAQRGSNLATRLAIDLVGAAHDQAARADLLELLAHPETTDHAAAALVGMVRPEDAARIAEVLASQVGAHERSRQDASQGGLLQWEAGAMPVVRASTEQLPGPGLYRCVGMLGALGGWRAQELLRDVAGRTTIYAGLRVAALRALAALPKGNDALPVFALDADATVALAAQELLARDPASWSAFLTRHPQIDPGPARERTAAADPGVDVGALLQLARLRVQGAPWQFQDVLATAIIDLRSQGGGCDDLIQALSEPLPQVRRIAAQSLCELRIPSGVAAVVATAGHGDADALRALQVCHDPAAEAAVITELSRPGTSAQSCLQVLEWWVPRGPAAISALLKLSHEHPDGQVRMAALHALHGPDPHIAAARLATAARDADPQVRGACILELVMTMGDPQAQAVMLAACDDPHRYVRACAVFASGATGQPWSRARLVRTLHADADDQVRAYAAAVLRATSDESVASALLAALAQDPSPRVRRAVAARLAQDCQGLDHVSQAPDALAAKLRSALKTAEHTDTDSSVRATIERALEHEHDEWLRPPAWQQDGAGDLGAPGGAG
jgi:RNA polymerase sigma-70 factor (ECF subfamily)